MVWYATFDANFWIVIAGIAVGIILKILAHRLELCGPRGWLICEPTDNHAPHRPHAVNDANQPVQDGSVHTLQMQRGTSDTLPPLGTPNRI